MTREAWLELMQQREKLTRFFNSSIVDPTAPNSTVFNLDTLVYVELPNSGEASKLASLVCNAAPDGVRAAVAFKETTWLHMVSLEPLVTHLLAVYAGHSSNAVEIFKGLAHVVYAGLEYIEGRDMQETLALIPDIVKNCNPEVYKDTAFDNFRVCEEIKLFCVRALYDECKNVEQQ